MLKRVWPNSIVVNKWGLAQAKPISLILVLDFADLLKWYISFLHFTEVELFLNDNANAELTPLVGAEFPLR